MGANDRRREIWLISLVVEGAEVYDDELFECIVGVASDFWAIRL